MYDVVVLGELNADLIVRGDVTPAWGQAEQLVDDAALVLGSSSAIFACGAARLGLRVAFVGVIGDDPLGHFCRDQLALRGVVTDALIVAPQRRTGLTLVLQRPGDRAMLTFLGTIDALDARMVDPALLAATRHVHVGSYFLQARLQPDLPALFARARRAGATTSLDTNWDPSGRWQGLDALLAETDILLPNEQEACGLAGASSWQEALGRLAARVPTVALKRGGDGAAAARGAELVAAPPLPVEVVDAVGAGDSFDAGFVCGQLQGWDLARSLRLAVACGSLSTRAAGGTAAQPTLDEALQEGFKGG